MGVIDIRKKEGDLGRNLSAVADLITALGQAEGIRQKRAQTQNVLDLLGQGKGIDEIAGSLATPGPTQFDPGFKGILQRVGSPFAMKPDPLDAISAALGVRGQQSLIAARESLTGQRETTAAEGPKLTVAGQKRNDATNIRKLNNPKVNFNQSLTALNELSQSQQLNDTLLRNDETDDLFKKAVKGAKDARETRKGGGKFGISDEINGQAVYVKAFTDIISEATTAGFTPQSTLQAFNSFWDERFNAEKGQGFQKFGDRAAFDLAKTFAEAVGIDGEGVGQPDGKPEIGSIIETPQGKVRVVDFAEDGEPLVEPI